MTTEAAMADRPILMLEKITKLYRNDDGVRVFVSYGLCEDIEGRSSGAGTSGGHVQM